MNRVVITGLGIVSSIGNNKVEVLDALLNSRSGIVFKPEYAERNFSSQVAGVINITDKIKVEKKYRRFMGDMANYAYLALNQAIEDAKLTTSEIANTRTGLIVGSSGRATSEQFLSLKDMIDKGKTRGSALIVPKTMANNLPAILASIYKIQGINYSITSACATSSHCIGNAMEQIQLGKQDIIFAGGAEEEHWFISCFFDAMGALSSQFNDQPHAASRPYDKKRNGFVISGGAGILVLESLEHAQKRNAHIYAELVGYGACADGDDMVSQNSEGAARCMKIALSQIDKPVDYINTHGTSTVIGDVAEIKAIETVFGKNIPPISSTKSISGHAMGAAGVHEAIYSILMMENNFIAPSINLETPDEPFKHIPIVDELKQDVTIDTVLSNSFGFGGTNASLIFSRY